MTKHWKKALPLLPLLLIWFFSSSEELSPEIDTVKSLKASVGVQRVPAAVPNLLPTTPQTPQVILSVPTQLKAEPWEEKLISALKGQSGGTAQDIQIKRVGTFPWKFGGQELQVESVIISLRNEQQVKTSFKALIDPQTGKILETWDQPVIDPQNPKESFKVKIDSRYHGI